MPAAAKGNTRTRMPRHALALFAGLLVLSVEARAEAREVIVHTPDELRTAVGAAEPGTTILIAPGKYYGGFRFAGVNGRETRPIVIAGRDPEQPPVFFGGSEALHLRECRHLVLRDIHVRGCPVNGINIDGGRTTDTTSNHLLLENVTIERIGPQGNYDALKLSGIDDFFVRNCTFHGWGGSAIDMVGCHRGEVCGCRFRGAAGFSQATGVQIKGGSSEITVRQCRFENVGDRAVNIGGKTGLPFFRPPAADCEAKQITVAGNWFAGSTAPVAFTTARDCRVHHNTFLFPEKWLLRILQPSPDTRFAPCGDGVFENNLIVFDERVQVFVNSSGGTDPTSFTFRKNAWHDTGGNRRPVLPAPETAGVYQFEVDTLEAESFTVSSDDPRLKGIGADADKPPCDAATATSDEDG